MAAASLLLPSPSAGAKGGEFIAQKEMKITQRRERERKKEGYKANFSGTILMQCKVIYVFCAPIKHVC